MRNGSDGTSPGWKPPSWAGTSPVVLTIGTFDVLHFGQIAFLRKCSLLGSHLVVGVNSDRFTGSYKRRPVMSQDERMYALAALGFDVTLNDGPGRDLIFEKKPGILAIGSDWARKDYYKQIDVTQDELDVAEICLAYVPYVSAGMPMSTSEIIRRIKENS